MTKLRRLGLFVNLGNIGNQSGHQQLSRCRSQAPGGAPRGLATRLNPL